MHGLPTDEQLPTDILGLVREQAPEGRGRLIAWLFEQFRSKVDPDRLATSLAHLMERMADGFVPERPVGLLRTMLFRARCDERRREEVARSFLADFGRASPLIDPDDAATLLERNELLSRITSEVFWRTDGTTLVVIWAHVNGMKYDEIASILARTREDPWSSDRARRCFFEGKQRLREQLRDNDPRSRPR